MSAERWDLLIQPADLPRERCQIRSYLGEVVAAGGEVDLVDRDVVVVDRDDEQDRPGEPIVVDDDVPKAEPSLDRGKAERRDGSGCTPASPNGHQPRPHDAPPGCRRRIAVRAGGERTELRLQVPARVGRCRVAPAAIAGCGRHRVPRAGRVTGKPTE